MKRAGCLLAALALCLATVAPVQAGGYKYGHGHRGYGHHHVKHGYYGHRHHGHRHYRHGRGGYVALGAIGGALLLGYLLTRPSYGPGYVASPAYEAPQARNCQPTTGTGMRDGRPAVFGGTWCEDAYGNGYILAGSEYFIGYAQ